MRLYTHPAAPNPAKVNFFANEKRRVLGDDFTLESIIVDLLKSEQTSPEFLERNPKGTLPVLVLDDGTVISESLPIMEYLEERFPDPPLIGRTPLERAQVRSLERDIEMNVLLRIIRAVHATRSPLGLPPNPTLAENELQRLPAGLARIEQQLDDAEFVHGDMATIADCTLLAALNFAAFGDLDILDSWPNLQRWQHQYALRHL